MQVAVVQGKLSIEAAASPFDLREGVQKRITAVLGRHRNRDGFKGRPGLAQWRLSRVVPLSFVFGTADFRGIENMTVISIRLNSLVDYFAPGGSNVGFSPGSVSCLECVLRLRSQAPQNAGSANSASSLDSAPAPDDLPEHRRHCRTWGHRGGSGSSQSAHSLHMIIMKHEPHYQTHKSAL